MERREKSSHDFALARTEQPEMSPARRVDQLATASGDRVSPVPFSVSSDSDLEIWPFHLIFNIELAAIK